MSTWTVGQTYTLPCLHLGHTVPNKTGGTITLGDWLGFSGWLPLLTAFCRDEDFFPTNFDQELNDHAHIAWQFVPKWFYDKMLEEQARLHRPENYPFPQHHLLAHTILREHRYREYHQVRSMPVECLREPLAEMHYFPGTSRYIAPLEQKYACKALENGRCPHRGTPVEAMTRLPDGQLVCPAHGLRFRDGRVVPRGASL